MSLVFLLGGARSGKSALAVRLADATRRPVVVIATAEARDDEMAERIETHRGARPASWTVVEEPLELGPAIERMPPEDAIVIDCLSLWLSNALEAGLSDGDVLDGARAAAVFLEARPGPSIVVSNEVGLGIVPMHPVGRRYRDLLGAVNAVWASAAAQAYLVVAGRAVPLLDAPDAMPR
jgi:adenosyl cobinamide kinase/adenosyl cobinamide phosphate guanylyltransferase